MGHPANFLGINGVGKSRKKKLNNKKRKKWQNGVVFVMQMAISSAGIVMMMSIVKDASRWSSNFRTFFFNLINT